MFLFRYLAARILQPEMVMFQIRPFAGWEITLEDFEKRSAEDKEQLRAEYDSLPEEEKALLALKQADRSLMEGSECANCYDKGPRGQCVAYIRIIPPNGVLLLPRGGC